MSEHFHSDILSSNKLCLNLDPSSFRFYSIRFATSVPNVVFVFLAWNGEKQKKNKKNHRNEHNFLLFDNITINRLNNGFLFPLVAGTYKVVYSSVLFAGFEQLFFFMQTIAKSEKKTDRRVIARLPFWHNERRRGRHVSYVESVEEPKKGMNDVS
jgi:hypothetical protein